MYNFRPENALENLLNLSHFTEKTESYQKKMNHPKTISSEA